MRTGLASGVYQPSPYRYFHIYEPKKRRVAAAPFRDRVVHHAVVRVLEPRFEKRFIEDSFACRSGKGTHAAMYRASAFARKFPYVLKCDIRKYFPSIDHEPLMHQVARVIGDRRVLDLIQRIVDSHFDSVVREWPDADDQFAVREQRQGLPIGNLTSQFLANVYLDGFDHFVKQDLRVRCYFRYVDDFVISSCSGIAVPSFENWASRCGCASLTWDWRFIWTSTGCYRQQKV
ncbi:MAG: RNA-directed DNA polymerase [Verrucomicrobiales bacterium]